MKETSVGELVRQAKGEDRSLREYARDSGVDAAIISRIINGSYIPKKPGIYEALTSPQAAPRGGVTCKQLMETAGTSEEYLNGMSAGMSMGILSALSEIPSAALVKELQARGIAIDFSGTLEAPFPKMKPQEVQRVMVLSSEMLRFSATANGIILGSLGKKGLSFQIVHTDGAEVDGVRFDTYVRLMDHEITEYLIRYAYISEREAGSLTLVNNTLKRMIEELIFLKPVRNRKISIVVNHPEAYEELCCLRDRISYNGELSVILFDIERAALLKENYLSHFISEDPVSELLLI